MSIKTSIGWAAKTLNPFSGCSPISEGCMLCYAARMAGTRLKHHPKYRGLTTRREDGSYRFTGEIRLHPEELDKPWHWKKKSRIFICSMCDLFHEKIPLKSVANVFQVIADNPQHLFLILTKRPNRGKQFYDEWWNPDIFDGYVRGGRTRKRPRLYLRKPGCSECRSCFLGCLNGRKKWKDKAITPNYRGTGYADYFGHEDSICDAFRWTPCGRNHGVAVEMDNGEISVRKDALSGPFPSPFKNLWLGVTAENQKRADERIPILLQIPATVRFVSIEPLLGPVDFGHLWLGEERRRDCGGCLSTPVRGQPYCPGHDAGGLDWVIVGAETGPGKHPPKPEWIVNIVEQCKGVGVPIFMKDNLKPYWPYRLIQEWPE